MNWPTALSSVDHVLPAFDLKMMRHCIELSAEVGRVGEFPLASVIARDGRVIAEAGNRVCRDADITRHAELLAVSEAHGKGTLKGRTLCANVEPCAMCSFPIRESRISRLLSAIPSRLMGGFSKFAVLTDCDLSRAMPEAFGKPPEVIIGVLRSEAVRVWQRWNPIIWAVISRRACLGEACSS